MFKNFIIMNLTFLVNYGNITTLKWFWRIKWKERFNQVIEKEVENMVSWKEIVLQQEELSLKIEEEREERILLQQHTRNNYPKSLRLLKRYEFLKTQKGKSFNHDSMVLTINKNNLDNFKFGVVVSKKVGNAVTRNYYKRIFRTFFRTNKPIFLNGYNYAFILRSQVKDYSFKDLEQVFISLVYKSKNEKLID